MSFNELDFVLVGANLGISLVFLLVAMQVRHAGFRRACAGVAASSLCLMLMARGESPLTLEHWLLKGIAVTGVFWFWALCRLLFEDHFRLRRWHYLLPAVLVLGVLVVALAPDAPGATFWRRLPLLTSTALGLHLLWRVGQAREQDLLEQRRALRLLFIAAGIGLPILLFAVRRFAGYERDDAELLLIQSGSLLAMKLLVARLLLGLRFQPSAEGAEPELKASSPPAAPADDDALWLKKLEEAMASEGLYRRNGLSIAALATHLALPEYRLRRLINQRLDYRNFNDFLNDWRLREALRRLREPAEAHLPILSIALDVGFGSIGPFNRAFKERLGMTPSEYRRSPDQKAWV